MRFQLPTVNIFVKQSISTDCLVSVSPWNRHAFNKQLILKDFFSSHTYMHSDQESRRCQWWCNM